MGLLMNLDNIVNALEFSLISKDTRSSFYFIFRLLKLEAKYHSIKEIWLLIKVIL